MAAGQHLRRCRCGGNQADRCVEAPRRGMHDRCRGRSRPTTRPIAERLRGQLATGGFAGVVVLTEPKNGNPDEECAVRGGEYVHHLVRIARELPEIPGESPRLYVVTSNAQTVLAEDRAQPRAGRAARPAAGDRRRAPASAHHPHRRRRGHRRRAGGAPIAAAARTKTKPPGATAQWYTARLCPAPLRPEERQTTVVDPRAATACGCRSARPVTCKQWSSPRSTAFRRGQDRSRSRSPHPASTSPMCWSPSAATPASTGRLPQLGTDFAGVVTAVGPDVTDHQVGDHVGGMSPNGCWATFVNCDARLAVTLPPG